ncbi:hypothetical protein AOQ84DRAFT_421258 [Glonium stellatum]|uniref:Uncharacterized protein n=1 Tax=Glonium stellatum TaxID=574774 RepID=A0A8E2F836_9PEZI|nr:hypothetical protein AOQ84DRAFT_421258 [Glonium stellatum]
MPPKSISGDSSVAGGTAGSDATSSRTAISSLKDPAGKWKQASNDLKDLQEITQRIRKNTQMYTDMEEAIKEHSKTRGILNEKMTELLEKEARISDLENNVTQMFDEFEARYKKWNNEALEFKRRSDREKTRTETAHQREVESMQTQLKSFREKVTILNTGIDQAKKDADFARRQNENNKHQMREWYGYLSQLKDMDLDALGVKLEGFFQRYFLVIYNNFYVELPDLVLKDIASFTQLTTKLPKKHRFSPTNSSAAKLMRVAAAVHIFAAELHATVFRPRYFLESIEDSLAMEQIMDRHLGIGCRESNIIRAVLLSDHQTEDEESVIADVARIASEHVHEQLRPLLRDDSMTFKTGLEQLFQEATKLWLEMQHSNEVIETHIEDSPNPSSEFDWHDVPIFGDVAQGQQIIPSEYLCLFPRFQVFGYGKAVHRGYVLWYDQEAVRTTHQELLSEGKTRNRRSAGGNPAGTAGWGAPLVTDNKTGAVASPQASPNSRKGFFLDAETTLSHGRTNN